MKESTTTPQAGEGVVTLEMLQEIMPNGGKDFVAVEATFKVVLKREGKLVGIIGGLDLYEAERTADRVNADALYQSMKVVAEAKYEGTK